MSARASRKVGGLQRERGKFGGAAKVTAQDFNDVNLIQFVKMSCSLDPS